MGNIHRDNYAASIFCQEIILYCEQVIYSHQALEKAAEHYLNIRSGIDCPQPFPPAVTALHCATILNAAKSLKNILYSIEKSHKKYKDRAEKILQMLGNPQLSAIQNVDTRNKWEHLDEYIQKYLEKPGPKSINALNVYDSLYKQDPSTVNLRAFNPRNLEIRHENSVACTKSLATEAVTLKSLAEDAIKQMGQGVVFQIIARDPTR